MYKYNTGIQCAPLCQVDVARNVKARVSGEMDEEQAVETTSQGALVPVLVPCRGDSLDHSPNYLFGSTFLPKGSHPQKQSHKTADLSRTGGGEGGLNPIP